MRTTTTLAPRPPRTTKTRTKCRSGTTSTTPEGNSRRKRTASPNVSVFVVVLGILFFCIVMDLPGYLNFVVVAAEDVGGGTPRRTTAKTSTSTRAAAASSSWGLWRRIPLRLSSSFKADVRRDATRTGAVRPSVCGLLSSPTWTGWFDVVARGGGGGFYEDPEEDVVEDEKEQPLGGDDDKEGSKEEENQQQDDKGTVGDGTGDADEDEGSVTAPSSSAAAEEEDDNNIVTAPSKEGEGTAAAPDDVVEKEKELSQPEVGVDSTTTISESHDDDDQHHDADADDGSSSSAYVDRMELADDEGGETTPGGGYYEDPAAVAVAVEQAPVEHVEGDGGEAGPPPAPTGTEPSEEDIGLESVVGAGTDAHTSVEASAASGASQPLEVTEEMKQVLTKELRYTKDEANSIKPDYARIAIKNRLSRPWEGMPPSWFRRDSTSGEGEGAVVTPNARRRKRLVTQITLSVIVGAAVVQSQVSNGRIDPSEIVAVFVAFKDRITAPNSARSSVKGKSSATSTVPKLQLSPRPATTATSSADSTKEDDSTASQADTGLASKSTGSITSASSGAPAAAAVDPLPVNEHVNALTEPHEHSVRPGVPSRPADESDLDVTWLDKAITAFERSVKSLFRIK